ncbi:MAG: DUF3991 and TOPRIM domain-containing protein [Eubacteriales bacterium]|nr:DUF3991 and TOPRIM domain-containing protein [Eubacteriales bacterium]
MPWVTEEQIREIKQIRAYDYLRECQPDRLKKTRTAGEWELADHDSFKINERNSKWHWKSRDIGGVSALRFLIEVDGYRFMEAVNLLKERAFVSFTQELPMPEKKPFVLPKPNGNNRRILQYLSGRGISESVIRYCLRQGILYESSPYHNAVFVGRDESGKARYAFLRGIYDNGGRAFKIEQAGSEKAYAFCVPPQTVSRRVTVYEACIDALAHMSLEGGRPDRYRLELGGISAPKEGEARREMKQPPALEAFLSRHPEIEEIEICTDNDFAGRWACSNIQKFYEKKYRVIANLPQIEGADYADLAKRKKEEKNRVQKAPER